MKRFGAISGLRARLLPMNKLRLVAPTNVLDAASRVTTAPTTTALYTTDPLAQQVARKAAGEELGELHQRLPCGGAAQGPSPARLPVPYGAAPHADPAFLELPAKLNRSRNPANGLYFYSLLFGKSVVGYKNGYGKARRTL